MQHASRRTDAGRRTVAGTVGAEAGARFSAGPDGIRLGGDGFAEGKVTTSVHGDVGGLGAGVTGEAWVGAGGELNATFGKTEDGKWHFCGEAGVALGVGGKIGYENTVDPGEVTDTLGDAAKKLNPFD
jgi:hypothetical protein